MTRRDRCYLAGTRAFRLTNDEAALAWIELSYQLVEFGEKDVPKFNELLAAIRKATLAGKRAARKIREGEPAPPRAAG